MGKDRVFVLGMARSGYEAARLLVSRGYDVLVNDGKEEQNPEHVDELRELGVELHLGSHPDDLFDEKDWKGSYLSVLRSQMSNYEQMLLYYNAQSSIGCAWNEHHFIEDYKLIKNIPYFSIARCAGIAPNVMYKKAIKDAEEKGEKFFERY